jgi:hypothetical protein
MNYKTKAFHLINRYTTTVMRNFLIIAIATLVLSPSTLSAGNEDRIGTAGATQLLINPWARSSGIANSGVASVVGIEGSFMNVAGLAFTRKTEIMFTNTDWMSGSDIAINAIGLAQRVGESGVIGLSVMSIDFGDFVTATEDNPEGDGSTYTVNNLNLALSYAKEFSNSIYGGISFRLLSESLFNLRTQGIAFDAGIKYVTGEKDQVKFGITLKNVGPPISFDGDGLSFQTALPSGNNTIVTAETRSAEHELPSLIQFGASYDFLLNENHTVTANGTFVSNAFSRDNLNFGAEYAFKNLFMLRGGYGLELADEANTDSATFLSGLTAGLSIQAPIGKDGGAIGFDYTYRDTSPFDGVHSIGARIDI